MGMVGRRRWFVGIGVVIGMAAALGVWWVVGRQNAQPAASAPALETSWTDTLPQANKSGIDLSHVATGVVPPTNKWFTGAVLQATPQPVFAMPNSYRPTSSGLEIGMPRPTATDKTIAAPHVPAMTLAIADAASYKLTRYDVLTLDLTYYDASGAPLAHATLVEGSPYMYVTADRATRVAMSGGRLQVAQQYARYTTPSGKFGVLNGQKPAMSSDIVLEKGQGMTVFSYTSDDEADWLAQYAPHRVTKASVDASQRGDRSLTTFTLNTHDNQSTVLGYMPHQTPEQPVAAYGRDTLYGTQRYASGTTFVSSVALPKVVDSLDLSHLGDAEKQELVTALQADVATLAVSPADSYYGGKAVYRKAQLLDIAKQQGQTGIEKKVQDSLTTDLSTWFAAHGSGERSFYYDSAARGVVGGLPAFGSEQFNDHHFHYGYFIYAASVLARYDTGFATQHRSAVESLVADIAQPQAASNLPQQRVFDAYMGHSWASGFSPFADGNNQESTAEAINAWTGVALWGRATSNRELESYGQWLLAQEASSAKAYWTQIDTSQPLYGGFGHILMSLNWGGKRDYATFFSADPGAMLAIQLLPLNPTMSGTLPSRTHITAQLTEAAHAELFPDYLAMYRAVVDKNAALVTARALPADKLDDGNSRAYMLAWIMTR